MTQNFGRSPGASLPPVGALSPPAEPAARTDHGSACSAATHPDPLPHPTLAHHPSEGTGSAAAPVPAPANACPEGRAPESSGFADTARSPHDPSIACVVWWGVAAGTGPGSFEPAAAVTRAQMARLLTRLLEAAGVDLPDPVDRGFGDILGSVHADAINQLAALGVTTGLPSGEFLPSGPVRRDQMAAFLVRTHELAAGRTLTAPQAPFTDHARSLHRTSIDKAAAAGFAAGTSATTYSPERVVRRDQMATFVARVLDTLVQEGLATPPRG